MPIRSIDVLYRDFEINGVPASGAHKPIKRDIRDTLKAGFEGGVDASTRIIHLSNTGEGTPNNIDVAASEPIPPAVYDVLFIIDVTQTNTGPVAISGDIERGLVTNTSQPVPSGYLQPGMAVLAVDTGTELRMLSYGDAAAIQAAAEAARDAALAAVPNAFPLTRTLLKALDTTTITSAYLKEPGREDQFFWKAGDYAARIASDPDEGLYIKADAVAATAGAWVNERTLPRSTNVISVGENYVNARIYGAGSGGDDSLIAEELFAKNPGSIIFFPDGVYNLNTELNVPAQNGNRVKGAGPNNSIFNKNSTASTGIKFDGTGVVGWGAEDFRVNGIGGTQTAGYGVDMPGVVGQGRVKNLQIYDCWRGIGLGPTDFSWFDSCIVTNCYSHGIHLRNMGGVPAASLQWQNTNNLSQMNNGSGMIYEGVAAAGLTQATAGKIEGYASFANFQYGFGAIGISAMAIKDIRLVNCFLGGDGQSGAFFDTFGGKHQITGGFFELIGRGNRGRNFATAAPALGGNGIELTANNDIVNIAGPHLDGNGSNGLLSSAGYVNIAGLTAVNNGGKLSAGQRNGIYHAAGEMCITGMTARNIGPTTAQEHAITCWDGGHLTISGADLRGNSGTAILYGANAGSVVSSAVRT